MNEAQNAVDNANRELETRFDFRGVDASIELNDKTIKQLKWCHWNKFKTIKQLDERFNFYYADNDYAMQLQKYNIKHNNIHNYNAYIEYININNIE